MKIQPYLFFNGRCEEAIDFYGRALGAKVTELMRFKESRETMESGYVPADFAEKVERSGFVFIGPRPEIRRSWPPTA